MGDVHLAALVRMDEFNDMVRSARGGVRDVLDSDTQDVIDMERFGDMRKDELMSVWRDASRRRVDRRRSLQPAETGSDVYFAYAADSLAEHVSRNPNIPHTRAPVREDDAMLLTRACGKPAPKFAQPEDEIGLDMFQDIIDDDDGTAGFMQRVQG